MKANGAALVEIHGQHDERALVDAATHRRLLDAFAGLEKDVTALETLWDARKFRLCGPGKPTAPIWSAPPRDADYLRHAADELKKLNSEGRRGEQACGAPHRHDAGREDRGRFARGTGGRVSGHHSPISPLAAAVRRLERRAGSSPSLVEPAVKAIDVAINALEEADQHLSAALIAADFDPAELERIEERLSALRGAARKYSTPVDGSPRWPRNTLPMSPPSMPAPASSRRAGERGRPRPTRRYSAAANKLSAGAHQVRREAQQGRHRRARRRSSSNVRNSSPQVDSDAATPGPQRHRPRRILGSDQSRHPPRAR